MTPTQLEELKRMATLFKEALEDEKFNEYITQNHEMVKLKLGRAKEIADRKLREMLWRNYTLIASILILALVMATLTFAFFSLKLKQKNRALGLAYTRLQQTSQN
ncbi:MAG: hypothetical protein HC880_21115 [Bacteroidia bacterium]|nr:hypothetical protein [Bacteroidia bacterium]